MAKLLLFHFLTTGQSTGTARELETARFLNF